MTMKSLLVATCLLAGGTALAQPTDPTATPPPDGTPQNPQPPALPHPPQPPDPQPRSMIRDDGPAEPEAAPEPRRPVGFSLGIGVGYRFPTPLQTPNVSSVRLRFASGFTLEPTVVFATTSHSEDMGSARTVKNTELGVGALGRFPLVQRGRTDLELLAAFEVDNLSTDPDADQTDDVRSVTTSSIRYGIAVGAWITPHLQASMSATNGLLTFVKDRQEQGLDTVTITTDTTFGVIFDPTVVFMLHLYN
jgi:hypothetical protein